MQGQGAEGRERELSLTEQWGQGHWEGASRGPREELGRQAGLQQIACFGPRSVVVWFTGQWPIVWYWKKHRCHRFESRGWLKVRC